MAGSALPVQYWYDAALWSVGSIANGMLPLTGERNYLKPCRFPLLAPSPLGSNASRQPTGPTARCAARWGTLEVLPPCMCRVGQQTHPSLSVCRSDFSHFPILPLSRPSRHALPCPALDTWTLRYYPNPARPLQFPQSDGMPATRRHRGPPTLSVLALAPYPSRTTHGFHHSS